MCVTVLLAVSAHSSLTYIACSCLSVGHHIGGERVSYVNLDPAESVSAGKLWKIEKYAFRVGV